jgi:hypothetical protein
MNIDQLTTAKNLLRGIKFLIAEAERNNIERIAKILRSCARDLCAAIKTHREHHD